jgi:arginyl-tRNA synthetase
MDFITEAVIAAVQHLYQTALTAADVNLQETRKEFEGQVTIVTFPYTRFSRKSPEQTGQELGAYIQEQLPEVSAFNVIKGFLNISLSDSYWLGKLSNEILQPDYTLPVLNGKRVMVEYSSPNTNCT